MARPAVTKTTELSSITGIDSADERLKKKKTFLNSFKNYTKNEARAYKKSKENLFRLLKFYRKSSSFIGGKLMKHLKVF